MWQKVLGIFNGNGGKPSQFAGRSILVVDDGETERRTARAILEKRGYRVTCAEDGEEALGILQRELFDLMILDVVMPKMSGPDLCKQIKLSDRTKNIPVIFLTGSDTPANVINCYDLGAEQFLAKPVEPKLLIRQIEGIFKENV